MEVYIRPCGAFPDGFEIPASVVPILERQGLIESSETWPGDYETVYDVWDDADMETVGRTIVTLVNAHKG